MVLLLNFCSIAVGMLWDYSGIAGIAQYCFGIAVRLPWDCRGIATALLW